MVTQQLIMCNEAYPPTLRRALGVERQSGFRVQLENGWTVSVQWATGINYCTVDEEGNARSVEIGIWHESKPSDIRVKGWVPMSEMIRIMALVKELPPTNPDVLRGRITGSEIDLVERIVFKE